MSIYVKNFTCQNFKNRQKEIDQNCQLCVLHQRSRSQTPERWVKFVKEETWHEEVHKLTKRLWYTWHPLIGSRTISGLILKSVCLIGVFENMLIFS